MTWLLIPSTDRAYVAKLLGWIDRLLGYPRQEVEGLYGAHALGDGRHVPWSEVRTETQAAALVHDSTGATALHGAVAISVDAVVDALRDRQIDPGDGVRRRLRDLITERGWQLSATLPGVDSAWSPIPVRDGAAGSTDGVPIPEGSE